MGIFYREKAFHARKKKIRKNDFAPSEKYSCYTPAEVEAMLEGFHVTFSVCTVGPTLED